MKNFSVFILSILAMGITTSCTKENFIKADKAQTYFAADKSELGIGD